MTCHGKDANLLITAKNVLFLAYCRKPIPVHCTVRVNWPKLKFTVSAMYFG